MPAANLAAALMLRAKDEAGFPPTFLQAGTRDLFLSNAVRMQHHLRD